MQANEQNKLFQKLKSNEDDIAAGDVRQAMQGLSAQQKARLDDILSSPEKMKALFDSDTAKALMNKMGKQGP